MDKIINDNTFAVYTRALNFNTVIDNRNKLPREVFLRTAREAAISMQVSIDYFIMALDFAHRNREEDK